MEQLINNKIKRLRKILEKKIQDQENYDSILKASQDLDEAINEYYHFTQS